MDGRTRKWLKLVLFVVILALSILFSLRTNITASVLHVRGLGQTITAPGIIINTIPETTPYSSKLPNILLDYVCPPGGFVKEDGAIGYDPSKPQRAIGISGIFSRNSGEPGEMTVEMSLVGHEGKGVVKNIPAASGAAVFQSIDNLSPNETLQYTLNVQMPNKKQITVKGDFPNNCEAPKTLIENQIREREASKGTK